MKQIYHSNANTNARFRSEISKSNLASISFSVAVLFLCCGLAFGAVDPEVPFLTPLRTRGFSLIPAPRQVELGARDVVIDGSWAVGSKVGTEDIAVKRLLQSAWYFPSALSATGLPCS